MKVQTEEGLPEGIRTHVKDILGWDPKQDQWKHRSTGMQCGTCMYYVPKVARVTGVKEIGRCRRHAPTMAGWPVMFKTDWCGDNRLDENKVQ